MANKIYNQDKVYAGNFALNYFDGLNVGSITTYAGDDTPEGCLACDGSAVSRTTYAKLFIVIGEKYGAGDGVTTFNVPNIIDPTDPALKYFIKADVSGSEVSNATNTTKGFVRFATDPEAEYSVREDVAINAKQLKLAVPKTSLRSKIYGTDDAGKQTHYNVGAFITQIVTIPIANSGTLSADELQTLKDSRNNVIERADIIFHYTSALSDGKTRYSAVNRYTDNLDYAYTILVDESTGAWTFHFERIYVCKHADVAPTTLANPSGVSGPCFYSVKNDIVTIQADGVSVSSAGTIYLWSNFPSDLLPKTKQKCTGAVDFSGGYSNCFFYVNPSGLRIKAWRTGTAYWANITYPLGGL